MPRTMPPGASSEPVCAGPAMEVHQVSILWDSHHSRWRSRCSCGWEGASRTRIGIDLMSAGHDIREWGK